jgi:ribosomal protein L23
MIKKPIFTEKSFLQARLGIYSFQVDRKTTKSEAKALIESMFKVQVVKCTSLISKAVHKRTGKKRLPSLTEVKKTMRVWLKKGQTLDLFDIKEA